MAEGAPKSRPGSAESGEQPAEGISQFIAKVLDQLSVSAWLPAAMLVGNVAVLVQLHQQNNLNIAGAVVALTQSPLGIIIVVFFSVVLATMVAQAFSFEAIRLLEGYWGRTRLTAWLIIWRTQRHRSRLSHLEDRRRRYRKRAFADAREAMLEADVKRITIDIHENRVFKKQRDLNHSDQEMEEADNNPWREYCRPSWTRRMDALDSEISGYPEPHRVLPTRLGNTIRAAEDLLSEHSRADLRGFVLRTYERIPEILRRQHDQFRTRLDMYCILVFVFVALTCLAPTLLIQVSGGVVGGPVATIAYAVLAWVSYQAAVSSGSAYGTILRVIDQNLA